MFTRLLGMCLIIGSLCVSDAVAQARTWKDKSGKFSIEAEVVEVVDGIVKLKRTDGRVLPVPMDKLSRSDLEYLREWERTSSEKEPGALPAGGDAEDTASETDSTKVELIGLAIGKPVATGDQDENERFGFSMGMGMSVQPGTLLVLSLRDGERQFIKLNEDDSKIVGLVDDKKTDLMKSPANEKRARNRGFGQGFIASQPLSMQVAEDRQSATVEIRAPAIPAPGAVRIELEAELAVVCGKGENTVEQANLSLTNGSKITEGPIAFEITEVKNEGFGDTQMTIVLQAQSAPDALKTLAFVDESGKEIPGQIVGRMSQQFGPQATHELHYGFEKKVDAASVRLTYFENVETVKIPVRISSGVGF